MLRHNFQILFRLFVYVCLEVLIKFELHKPAVWSSRSLFLGKVPMGTISNILVPIWYLFYDFGPYSEIFSRKYTHWYVCQLVLVVHTLTCHDKWELE